MQSKKIAFQEWLRILVLLMVLLIIAGNFSCGVIEVVQSIAERTIELKVMTYNIYHADPDGPNELKWRNRKTTVVQNIESIHPDVFGVQEAGREQIDYLLDMLPDYSWYGVGRDDGYDEGEHAAIFYLKDRFHVDDQGTFWFSNRPDIPGTKPGDAWGNPHHPRICSWVRLIETETNKAFYFYNLHLEHGSHGRRARERSVELLGSRISSRAHPENLFLVVGDFNAESTTDAISYVVDNLKYLDTYAETNENPDDGYTSVGWSGNSGRRIDYIFAHQEADGLLTDSYVAKRSGSDHYPLVTKLLLPIDESE